MREHAHYFRVSLGERRNIGLGGGEGGIRTPETLSSLHAFQACALNRALPTLRGGGQYAISVLASARSSRATIAKMFHVKHSRRLALTRRRERSSALFKLEVSELRRPVRPETIITEARPPLYIFPPQMRYEQRTAVRVDSYSEVV